MHCKLEHFEELSHLPTGCFSVTCPTLGGAAGASFLPYLITDRVVAPENCQHCYSEHLAYMPNCYFVNDYKAAHQDVLDEANLPTR